jgi:PII-like signaling protein
VVTGPALKLTVTFAENARAGRALLSDVLGDLCEEHGIEAAVLVRAVEGFGAAHRLRTDRDVDVALDLPLVWVAVDRTEAIAALVPAVRRVLRGGLVTVERAHLTTGALDAVRVSALAHEEVKLTIYAGRRERAARRPAWADAVDALHRRGLSGATVALGLDGMLHGRRRRARFLSTNADVPVTVVSVGRADRLEQAFPDLAVLLRDPLVTLERVTVCKRDGELLRDVAPLPADPDGRGPWHKLTVFAASGARHEGRPLGRELVRRLFRAGVGGATLTRGFWGFSGDHAPHGDRGLAIRRDSPIVVTVVCPPEERAAAWATIDEITGEHGLVTAEVVPTLAPGRMAGAPA